VKLTGREPLRCARDRGLGDGLACPIGTLPRYRHLGEYPPKTWCICQYDSNLSFVGKRSLLDAATARVSTSSSAAAAGVRARGAIRRLQLVYPAAPPNPVRGVRERHFYSTTSSVVGQLPAPARTSWGRTETVSGATDFWSISDVFSRCWVRFETFNRSNHFRTCRKVIPFNPKRSSSSAEFRSKQRLSGTQLQTTH